MEKDYFINSGIPPPLQFEPTMPFPSWNTNWDHHSSDHQFNPFNSTLNSIASNNFNDNNNTNNSTNNSCYTTLINSPPKLHIPSMMGKDNLLNLESSLNPLSTDPGFAQRAAKFSCFGSRSFNGRTTSPLGLYNNAELSQRSTQQFKNGKLPRVSSSPALKHSGSLLQIKNLSKLTSSNESGSEPSGETGSKTLPTELNSRKRKSVSRVKTKQDSPANGNMGGEVDDSARAKRCKQVPEGNQTENGIVNMEESKDNEDEKEAKPEPPKDYIHVRARRGQATDSHSLAERVRREKISERMKLLQDLVPGCNKVTGKALMLDEIINYVESLQRQVEFLSMKLSSVNSSLDFPEENLLSKDICQPNGSIPQPVLPSYQQPRQPSQLHTDIPNGALSQCSVDTLDASLCRSLGLQLPSLDGFGEYLNQFPTMCEDDLQSIVQMGFTQNPNKDLALPSQGFPVPNQTSHMKIEM